jgi:DNA-binding MarR family transcriptional regulator
MAPPSRRAAWFALLQAHSALVRVFEQDLHADCGMPVQWYDVLIRLWLAPGHAMRMSELADSVLLSRSWLTRRVEQLEGAGLVERSATPDDGRGVLARLTAQGKREFARAERSHAASIERHVSRHLSADEASVLVACAQRLTGVALAALQPGGPEPSGPTPAVRSRRAQPARSGRAQPVG